MHIIFRWSNHLSQNLEMLRRRTTKYLLWYKLWWLKSYSGQPLPSPLLDLSVTAVQATNITNLEANQLEFPLAAPLLAPTSTPSPFYNKTSSPQTLVYSTPPSTPTSPLTSVHSRVVFLPSSSSHFIKTHYVCDHFLCAISYLWLLILCSYMIWLHLGRF